MGQRHGQFYSKAKSIVAVCVVFLFMACGHTSSNQNAVKNATIVTAHNEKAHWLSAPIKEEARTVKTRFLPPKGFVRLPQQDNSFAAFLQQLPLKPFDAPVLLYGGNEKTAQDVHLSVIDLPIGKKDLHQCADAVMRLRADFLRQTDRSDEITFNLTNGFPVPYKRWMNGDRVKVSGNKCSWYSTNKTGNSDQNYWSYLEFIWMYAGTLSLSKEMNTLPIGDLKIGSAFVQGGSPGHAIIVIDQAQNPLTHERVFMLAQSYMPAQELHVLKNPSGADGSPWYSLKDQQYLNTPEWSFKFEDLKQF